MGDCSKNLLNPPAPDDRAQPERLPRPRIPLVRLILHFKGRATSAKRCFSTTRSSPLAKPFSSSATCVRPACFNVAAAEQIDVVLDPLVEIPLVEFGVESGGYTLYWWLHPGHYARNSDKTS
jgi:hypothetical protein